MTFDELESLVQPADVFTFGRQADLVVDQHNRHLHRILGSFHCDEGSWTLTNHGRSISLVMTDHSSGSFIRVTPGTAVPIPFAESSVQFSAGRANYRLSIRTAEPPASTIQQRAHSGTVTATTSSLVFNEEQLQLLEALASCRADGPITTADLPSSRQMAQMLGWSLSKFNRKLDRVCERLAKAGIPDLAGDTATSATERRLVLANYAFEQGVGRQGHPPG